MKSKKLCRAGMILAMAALLLAGAVGQDRRENYHLKASLGPGTGFDMEVVADAFDTEVLKPEESKESEREKGILKGYYGTFRITEFYYLSNDNRSFIRRYLTTEDSDRLLGRKVCIEPERLAVSELDWDDDLVITTSNHPTYYKDSVGGESDAILTEMFGSVEQAEEKGFGRLVLLIYAAGHATTDYLGSEYYFYAFDDKDKLLLSYGNGVFLLERCEEEVENFMLEEIKQRSKGRNLSDWEGRYIYSNDPGENNGYEIEIYQSNSGEYEAEIEIKSGSDKGTKLKAYVCEYGGKIIFIFQECLTGQSRWDWENRTSDILLSFSKDADTGKIYTDWGELDRNREPGDNYFVKEEE